MAQNVLSTENRNDPNEVKLDIVPYMVRKFSNYDRNQFKLIRDAYYNSGGFYDGTYLEQFSREENDKYAYRVKNKKYTNFMSPVVEGLVNPILYRDPVRDFKSDLTEAFVDRPTLSDQTMTSFMYETTIKSLLYGGVFVVGDNFPEDMQPADITTAIDERVFPYVYSVDPLDVQYYAFDRFGRLIYLTYAVDVDVKGDTIYQCFRLANESDVEMGFADDIGDPITYNTDVGNSKMDNVVMVASMPYFYKLAQQYDRKIFPISPMSPLADGSKNMFQINSLIFYQHSQLTFPILTYNGQPSKEMALSEDSVLFYNQGHERPGYIAPPTDTLEMLYQDRNNTKLEIQEMTHQAMNSVSSTASGEARKQADKMRQETLAFIEKRMIELERWVFNQFEFFTGVNDPVEITYQSNLDSDGVDEDIANIGDILDRFDVSEETQIKLKLMVLRKVFSSMSDTEFETIETDEMQNRVFGDQPPVEDTTDMDTERDDDE